MHTFRAVFLMCCAMTAVFFTAVFCPGCDRDETVTLTAGDIAGDNGTLVYEGQEYTGTEKVTVDADDLVGAVVGGEAYLYTPLLGDVDLSEANNRRAVACTILGTPEESQATVARVQAADAAPAELDKGVTVKLDSGLRIRRLNLPGVDRIEVTNLARRWVALKIPGESGTVVRLIPPAGKAWDSNISRWLTANDFPVPDWMLGDENPRTFFASLDSMEFDVKPGDLQVFGAVWQVAPQAFVSDGWPTGTDAAWKTDTDLYWWLNAYGVFYFVSEGVRNFISTVSVLECFDAVIATVFNNLTSFMAERLDPTIEQFFDQVQKEDVRNSFNNCLAIPATVGVSEILSTFFDIVMLFDWMAEDVVAEYAHLKQVTSFDTVKITGTTSGCDASQYLSFRVGEEEITDQSAGQYCETDLYIKNTSADQKIWVSQYMESSQEWFCAGGLFSCEPLEPGEEVLRLNSYSYFYDSSGECTETRNKKFVAFSDSKTCEEQYDAFMESGTVPSGITVMEYDPDVCRCY